MPRVRFYFACEGLLVFSHCSIMKWKPVNRKPLVTFKRINISNILLLWESIESYWQRNSYSWCW